MAEELRLKQITAAGYDETQIALFGLDDTGQVWEYDPEEDNWTRTSMEIKKGENT